MGAPTAHPLNVIPMKMGVQRLYFLILQPFSLLLTFSEISDIIEECSNLLLKIAYFPNEATMTQAVSIAEDNDVYVIITGERKDIFNSGSGEEKYFAMFCDEKEKGTNLFLHNGATNCGYYCTGALA